MRRRTIFQMLLFLLLVPLGAMGGLWLDFAVAGLIYPNPCIYHFRPAPTHFLFTAFFDYHGGTGYHPEPSLMSVIFYGVLGAAVGAILAGFLSRLARARS